MSDYFQRLGDDEKVRYEDKLAKVGISIGDDPYLSNGNFSSDMLAWPCVEYGHIFSYLIIRPGVYTQEQLLSWKQLEGYNYFQSYYVRTVWLRVFDVNKNICVLKAFFNLSQCTPDNAHEARVITKTDGTVITGHCTSMAG